MQVDYSGGYSSFSLARFGQQFQGLVANPHNILNWFRKRQTTKLSAKRNSEEDFCYDLNHSENAEVHVAKLIEEELKKEQLVIISEKTLVEALTQFVEKEENDALSDCVKFCLEESQIHLKSIPPSNKDISVMINEKKEELHRIQETKGMESMRLSRSMRVDSFADESRYSDDDSDTSMPKLAKAKSTRGRGSRGRGSRAGKSTTSTSSRGRGSKRGRGAKAAATSPALTFQSDGASTRKSQRTGKRAVSYQDNSPPEEDTFSHPAKKSRSTTSSGRSQSVADTIDLTQSGEDSGSSDDNPFAAFGKKSEAKLRKKK